MFSKKVLQVICALAIGFIFSLQIFGAAPQISTPFETAIQKNKISDFKVFSPELLTVEKITAEKFATTNFKSVISTTEKKIYFAIKFQWYAQTNGFKRNFLNYRL